MLYVVQLYICCALQSQTVRHDGTLQDRNPCLALQTGKGRRHQPMMDESPLLDHAHRTKLQGVPPTSQASTLNLAEQLCDTVRAKEFQRVLLLCRGKQILELQQVVPGNEPASQ